MVLKPPALDPAYDILRTEQQALSALFAPKTVAVVGATDRPGSVGRTLLWNLISNPFGGTVFPVNPKRHSVLGIRAYASIRETPESPDLVIIATPAPTVPGIIEDCVAVGVKGAIVLSAGFKEIGAAGIALEQRIRELLRHSPLRLIGPNCLGLMNPLTGLNATFASTMARPGNVGFISQSGALCTAVLDWSLQENVGFSAFVSMGSMLDVDWGDLIYYLGDDPRTHSIVIYMESIGNARSFLSAAREVALTKPIIVIKAGRTAAAAQAAASHTGSLAGSDAVLDAAFRRCGVLRVDRISELFDLAEVLAKQHQRPQGPRLTIITNAGGPGVLATDALIATGGELAPIADETVAQLDEFLPTHWSKGNPIDILGDADPDRYTQTLEVAVQDPNSDGLLVVLTPQAMTDPTETAEKLKQYAQNASKTVLASWMGGLRSPMGRRFLTGLALPPIAIPMRRRGCLTSCGSTATTSRASTKPQPYCRNRNLAPPIAPKSPRSLSKPARNIAPF
jgi:acetyltransferase